MNHPTTKGHEPDPPKKPRGSKYHEGSCQPCAIWEQTGGDPKLIDHHSMLNSCHAGKNASLFSKYLTWGSKFIVLEEQSCMCKGCWNDCNKNVKSQEYDVEPRWSKIISKYLTQHHCPVCHVEWDKTSDLCPCRNASSFVSYKSWNLNVPLTLWQFYFVTVASPLLENLRDLYQGVYNLSTGLHFQLST